MAYENPKHEFGELTEGLVPRLSELLVCLSHSWGGLEQVAANDAAERSALGLKVQALVLEGTPIHENLVKQPGVTVVPLSFRPRDYFDFKLRTEILRHVADGVNLVHTHQTSLLGSIAPWLWRRPSVALFASRHIMNSHDKRDFFHRSIYGRLDALIAMSHTLRKNILDTHPIREKYVNVVPLGLDFQKFDPGKVDIARQRAEWGADDDTLVIGLVGRIDPAKGQATFIRAAAGLSKSFRGERKLKFVMVGEETLGRASDHLGELKRMVAQFRLEDRIVFAGYQQNIPEVMSSFDVLVMPSRQEAFGLVAIEAMAMETPIIISNGGSAAEIVGLTEGASEEFGVLTRPEDAFDLQQQLLALLSDPGRCQQMGKRARQHVMQHYDRRTRIHRTLELYDWALRKRSRI